MRLPVLQGLPQVTVASVSVRRTLQTQVCNETCRRFFDTCRFDARVRCRRPLLNFCSSSECDRTFVVRSLSDRTPLRVWNPTAHAEKGSDIPRVCLTRLRCVFRVFHPLDAFFLPKPFRRISDGNAPGFELFGDFPFHGAGLASRLALPAWCWLKRPAPARRPTVLAHLPGFTIRGSPLFRCRKRRRDPILP
jgi:hypothetical protein